MLKNYLTSAIRNIYRNKATSFINIFSLSIGLACAVIVSMMVIYENSFDDFHENEDRVYRVYTQANRAGNTDFLAPVQYPLLRKLEESIPEIETTIKVTEFNSLVSYNDKNFYETVLFTDEEFFEVFSFPLKQGASISVLNDPKSVVLSESISKKYFGDDDPMGKTITARENESYKVTGIFYDLPKNSSIQADFIVSNNGLNSTNFNRYDAWTNFGNDYGFVLLRSNTDVESVERKITEINRNNINTDYSYRFKYHLMPLSEVHFSNNNYDFLRTTPPIFLIVFSILALFFLLIACINFINLSTARSAKRNKEVGIRKVIGAKRNQLITQFLSEAFILTLTSLFFAFILVSISIPFVNELTNNNLHLGLLSNPLYILIITIIVLFTGAASGTYPAFVLSASKPITVLQNSILKKQSGYSLRAGLVVFQFAISIFLMLGTITVYSQLEFLLSKNLGFNKDRIIAITIEEIKLRESIKTFKTELLRNPEIAKATFSSRVPGGNISSQTSAYPEGGDNESEVRMQLMEIDYDFISTYQLKILKGRNFSPEFSTDTSRAILINKTAMTKLGYDEPIGKRVRFGNDYYTIVGVVNDFHYSSLKNNILPLTFSLNINSGRYLSVQLSKANVTDQIDYIKHVYSDFSPNHPFSYDFLSENFEKYFRAETTIGKLLSVLSILAIIISCVGILGLVSFTAEQKSKEIGVRKVLGASVSNIVFMLGKEFLKWVLIANIIIWPIAYYLLEEWLSTFAYRIGLNYLVFFAGLIISLVITIGTVSYHSIKAANANPVESLKYE